MLGTRYCVTKDPFVIVKVVLLTHLCVQILYAQLHVLRIVASNFWVFAIVCIYFPRPPCIPSHSQTSFMPHTSCLCIHTIHLSLAPAHPAFRYFRNYLDLTPACSVCTFTYCMSQKSKPHQHSKINCGYLSRKRGGT